MQCDQTMQCAKLSLISLMRLIDAIPAAKAPNGGQRVPVLRLIRNFEEVVLGWQERLSQSFKSNGGLEPQKRKSPPDAIWDLFRQAGKHRNQAAVFRTRFVDKRRRVRTEKEDKITRKRSPDVKDEIARNVVSSRSRVWCLPLK